MLVRERFSSISAAVSIRSKPNSRFQTLCFSFIIKQRICPRRCVAAQIVAFTFSDILVKSFKNQIKNAVARLHLIHWSLERSPEKVQAFSGSLAAHSLRSFDRCLLHWRPPCSALGRFLGRLYSTYSSRTPLVPSGPVMFLLSVVGYRQISTVTRSQAHPSGFLHWARGPCSRAAGGSLLLTGAVPKARSAGDVSGSLLGRSVLKPKLFVARLSFVPSPTLLHKFQVISKFPTSAETRQSPIVALRSSKDDRLIVSLVLH